MSFIVFWKSFYLIKNSSFETILKYKIKYYLIKKTNSQCLLTDIENDILIYLLSNKISYKKIILKKIF